MKITETELLDVPSIKRIDFEGNWYFDISDVAEYLKEDLFDVENITLPFLIEGERMSISCATIDDIERGRKNSLTEFDKNILKALNFNPKKK